jgi:hypothetical protein
MEAIGRAGGEARGRARQLAAQQAVQQVNGATTPRFQDRETSVSVSREGLPAIGSRQVPLSARQAPLGAAELP